MDDEISDNRKKRGRPAVGSIFVGVRLPPDQIAALDAWIAAQSKPMSRPEAVRALMARGLPHTTEVSTSDEEHSWGGTAVMTEPKPRKLK